MAWHLGALKLEYPSAFSSAFCAPTQCIHFERSIFSVPLGCSLSPFIRSMDDRPCSPPARPCPSSLSRARKFRGLDNDLCDSANCRHRSTVVIVGRIERITVLTGLRILVLPGSISQKQQHNGTPLVHVTYARININDCIYDNLYGGTNASQLNLSILANVIDHRVFVTTNYAIFPY